MPQPGRAAAHKERHRRSGRPRSRVSSFRAAQRPSRSAAGRRHVRGLRPTPPVQDLLSSPASPVRPSRRGPTILRPLTISPVLFVPGVSHVSACPSAAPRPDSGHNPPWPRGGSSMRLLKKLRSTLTYVRAGSQVRPPVCTAPPNPIPLRSTPILTREKSAAVEADTVLTPAGKQTIPSLIGT